MERGVAMARKALHGTVRLALLLLAVSFVTFALVAASPIDPVQANVGQVAYLTMGPDRRAALHELWGTDVPLLARYGSWLAAALGGDLGTSLRFNAPVVQVLGERLAASALLLLASWALSGALGFIMGVVAAVRRSSFADRAVCAVCYVLSATPAFWLALVTLMVFSVGLGWFPIGFAAPVGVGPEDVSWALRLHHLALPALVLSLTGIAPIALHTRDKAVEAMESPYARFARARGESDRRIMLRHGLRNVAAPALMLQFASVGEVVGGSVLVEQVFSYPGLGQAAVAAGLGGDAPLLVGIALLTAALVFVGNACADVLHGALDPRAKGGDPRVPR